MADPQQADDDVEMEQEDVSTKDRQSREQAAALGRMTDSRPDAEVQMNDSKVKQAMVALAAAQKASKDAERQREKELAAVKVAKEDIDVVALEFDVDKKLAERRLRECGGDLKKALQSFLL